MTTTSPSADASMSALLRAIGDACQRSDRQAPVAIAADELIAARFAYLTASPRDELRCFAEYLAALHRIADLREAERQRR
ncbi:MAG: hypothetical protein H0W72_10710 [Planctomycetes bacterium]|nr:hypothetical protein [Planctomycetota bacterium]